MAIQSSHDSVPIHIEVPVTITHESRSVNDLTIEDFEVYENGRLQQIDALYFVSQRRLERRVERKKFSPNINRNFYLFFEISTYSPAISDAVEFFVKDAMYSGDFLTVVTPKETYKLRKNALQIKSRYEVTTQLKGIVRKDAERGSAEYRDTIQQLNSLATSIASSVAHLDTGEFDREHPLEEQLLRYADLSEHIETLGQLNDELLLEIAEYLKEEIGQKYVFLIFQHDDIPRLTPDILKQLLARSQDNPGVISAITTIFDTFNKNVVFDVERVIQACGDSSITINFLFIPGVSQEVPGINFVPKSKAVFPAVSQIASLTGGIIEQSPDPSAFMQKCLALSENYYLLYYSPQNFTLNGEFREIKVQVRDQALVVFHRNGYYAD